MPNFIVQMFAQLREMFQGLSISQKISLMVAVSAILTVIFVTAIWSNKPQYKPIFSGVSGENTAEIVNLLDGQKIPYRISDDGMTVSVPSDKVQAARLIMTGEVALLGGAAGFELFDEKNIGMTEFMQKLNYQRALQGEIARTISQLAEVDFARVHIVMPKDALFEDKKEKASASVVLKLKRGRGLNVSQISGITSLVANAVEGMDAERVTVIDSRGNVLTKGERSGASVGASTNHEIQQTFERNIEQKVLTMLNRAVGEGNSIVRVAAVMDFEQTEKVEEIFDPDSVVVRSEDRSEESFADMEGMPEGVPGVGTNIGGEAAAAGAAGSNSNKKRETINYEVSRTTKKTVAPLGTVKKLSVAVLIDGTYEADEEGNQKYIPRSAESLKTYEKLVKNVVGFNPDRGDRFEIASVAFETADTGSDALTAAEKGEKYQFFISLARNISIALVALLFLVFVIRPLVKWLIMTGETDLTLKQQPVTVGEMEAALLPEGAARKGQDKERLLNEAKASPDLVYNVVKGWVKE